MFASHPSRSSGPQPAVQCCQVELRVVGRARSRASGRRPLERGSLDPVGAAPPIWLHDRHRRRCPWLHRRSVLSWWRVSPSRARGTARTAWPRHTPASCRSGASSSGQGPRPSRSPPPGRPPRGGLSMAECRAAFYARVSSEAQARDRTIASQVAALRERVAADGATLSPASVCIDEGHSGSSLVRPALEKLRDAVAAGEIDRVYVLAPDRLARRHAHQALLMEEFRRAGVEVTFLNRPIGAGPEDDLLLQTQGVIAEYERAQILERSRRGRRHAARSGSVSALAGAPYGYRYVTRDRGGGAARFGIVPEEARFVRLIFAWVGLERLSLREVCRRLRQAGCRTRSGSTRWWASTIHGMVENPAYTRPAMYGRFHAVEPKPRLRPVRNHPPHASRPTTRVPVPPAEWVAVPVPALIDPAIAAAARAQLAENRRRKREQCRGPGWLLQGLVVCRRCGYAYYGKATPGLAERHRPGPFGYGAYRCIGSDGHRFDGRAVCSNRPVRSDHLERAVWAEIEAVLNDPQRIAHEYRRRLTDLAGAAGGAGAGRARGRTRMWARSSVASARDRAAYRRRHRTRGVRAASGRPAGPRRPVGGTPHGAGGRRRGAARPHPGDRALGGLLDQGPRGPRPARLGRPTRGHPADGPSDRGRPRADRDRLSHPAALEGRRRRRPCQAEATLYRGARSAASLGPRASTASPGITSASRRLWPASTSPPSPASC